MVSATRDTGAWLSEMLGLEGDEVEAVTDGAVAFQNTWPELTGRMVFICAQPSESIEAFVASTGVPFVRGPVTLMDLREAVRAVRSLPRPRTFV